MAEGRRISTIGFVGNGGIAKEDWEISVNPSLAVRLRPKPSVFGEPDILTLFSRLATERTRYPSSGRSSARFPDLGTLQYHKTQGKDGIKNSPYRNPPWLWFAQDSASLAGRKDLYAPLGGKGRSFRRTPENTPRRPLGLGRGQDIP